MFYTKFNDIFSDEIIEWADANFNIGHYLLATLSCLLISFFLAMTLVVLISSEKRLGAYEQSKLGCIRTNEGYIRCSDGLLMDESEVDNKGMKA